MCGKRSLTGRPHWPCCLKAHGLLSHWRLPLAVGILRFGERLAVELGEFRLGIERIDVRHAAIHETEDDVFGPRGEVRLRPTRLAASGAAARFVGQSPASATSPNPLADDASISRREGARPIGPGSGRWDYALLDC